MQKSIFKKIVLQNGLKRTELKADGGNALTFTRIFGLSWTVLGGLRVSYILFIETSFPPLFNEHSESSEQ